MGPGGTHLLSRWFLARLIIIIVHSVQDCSGVHPASYAKGTGSSIPRGVKREGREANQSPPSCGEVELYTPPLPPIPL
jgi:hypothetical protein